MESTDCKVKIMDFSRVKVVINAGGLGTRISSYRSDVPKPMIKICDKPILERQIDCLKAQGFNDFIIITGHLGYLIEEYFLDGKKFGVNISYFREENPLGTAGALLFLKEKIKDDFLFIFADIIFDIDFGRFLNFHFEKKSDISLFVHPNDHPFDSTLIKVDKDSRIKKIIPKESKEGVYRNLVNSGIHILSPKILESYKIGEKLDFDRDLLFEAVLKGNSFAYVSSEYVKDAGTKERLFEVEKDIISQKVAARNLINKQKAIFLDRDGTINKYKEHICSSDDFELIEGVEEAIKKINSSDYLSIVITNQPVIAKGMCTEKELENIHIKMESLLGEKRAYVDAIYYCPHHPEKGFEGEVEEYKISCDCRKPSPGLILAAANDFNIDLKSSYMVGDSKRDIEAGIAAGCKTVFISEEKEGIKGADYCYENLKTFVEELLD